LGLDMTPDAAMKIAKLTVMAAGLLVPPLLAYFLLRLLGGRRAACWAGAALALAGGICLVFFRLFPDTLHPAAPPATVEVILPDQYRGWVDLFFDSRQKALQPAAPGVYSLLVPASGRLRAGQFPGQSISRSNTLLVYRYLNGDKAPLAAQSLHGGGQARAGWSVAYYRAYIGPQADYLAARREKESRGQLFDEPQVLEQMRAQVKKSPSEAAGR
jgi:hypothetical protein